MKNITRLSLIVILLTLGSGCTKKCPVPHCQMVLDHQHFFGAEDDASGQAITKDSPLPDGATNSASKKKKGLFSKIGNKINPFKKKSAAPSDSTASNGSGETVITEEMRQKTDVKAVGGSRDKNLYKGTTHERKGGLPPIEDTEAEEEEAPRTVGSTLPVYRGVPWWRRIFKKKYRTEQDLKYKKMDKLRYSGKNKQELKKIYIK